MASGRPSRIVVVTQRSSPSGPTREQEHTMKRFIIEREIPGASELTEAQLVEIARTSNAAVDSLGVPYRWVKSYVFGDKMICVHEADDEAVIREHSRRGGFPVTSVTVVANEFGPQTAELAQV